MDFTSFEVETTEGHVEALTVPSLASIELSDRDILAVPLSVNLSKDVIRTSLRASTWDGVFAAIFSNITGGVLLTGFLMQLGASAAQIGILAAIPMVANLVQPIGAYLSEQVTSRHQFCIRIYGVSRLLWLILAIGIFVVNVRSVDQSILIPLTLAIAFASYVLGALGSAPWLSWMTVLVPRKLRGRYFGFRNSAANLTNLVSIPLMGLVISRGFGNSLSGYGVVLLVGIVAGIVSLSYQRFMADVNPQEQRPVIHPSDEESPVASLTTTWKNSNLLIFLLYFSVWMFSLNLSAPFFNLYLLDNLALDIGLVTLYNSLTAAANLVMLIVWGKLADRLGNRPILLTVGILVAVSPLLWLGVGTDPVSIWLWIPLVHILLGGIGAAIDLCGNNLQIEVAPLHHQSTFFGVVAAVTGLTSALGTIVGGFLAQNWSYGGLLGLFALSSIVRLCALLPLVFVREQHAAA